MKKSMNYSPQNDQIVNDQDFQYLMAEIINDLIEKRKDIHLKYDQLIKKLWLSNRQLNYKTTLAKYILGRLLRESDKAFSEAQLMARKICPKCKKKLPNYENFSMKLH